MSLNGPGRKKWSASSFRSLGFQNSTVAETGNLRCKLETNQWLQSSYTNLSCPWMCIPVRYDRLKCKQNYFHLRCNLLQRRQNILRDKQTQKVFFTLKNIHGGSLSELKVVVVKVPDFILTVVWFGFFSSTVVVPCSFCFFK